MISIGLLAPVIAAIIKGSFDTVFYPLFTVAELDTIAFIGYISYAVLLMIPIILKLLETFRWKYLMSKI